MNSSYMKKIFLSLLVLLFLSASVKANGEPIDENAGSGIITGRVIDETDISLPGATIQIIGTSKGTVTDIDGHFRIAGLPGNRTEFELTVSYVGYETVSRNITLGGNRTANIIIKMESNVVLDEVVVKRDDRRNTQGNESTEELRPHRKRDFGRAGGFLSRS